jgi:hypothetical protein
MGAKGAHRLPAGSSGAAGAAGAWNAVPAQTSGQPLVDLAGASVAATLTCAGGFINFDYENFATTGGDDALLDDCQDLGGPTSVVTWTFAGLQSGDYDVLTYAWAPDNPTFLTNVAVAGSSDIAQDVGGAWSGSHQLGVTFARHHVSVATGTLTITLTTTSGFGSLNGIQLVRAVGFTPLCAGDGSGTACPCGNSGGAGRGCASSVNPQGGLLAASGFASVAADSFVLTGSGMPDSSALYFQGTSALASGAGAAFGDGLRCAGGTMIRLGTKTNAGGASQYPAAGDAPVSVRGATAPGDVRVYQVWYRNAASFCQPEPFNLTNGVRATWGA